MMKIKDPFTYSARWDSAGISCIYCEHSNKNNVAEDWPTDDFRCNRYNISLKIELTEQKINGKGGIEGEWFCKSFKDTGAFPKAMMEFMSIKDNLEDYVLYECIGELFLKNVSFSELKS